MEKVQQSTAEAMLVFYTHLQEKYDEIMNCISMMKHFECNRLR